MQQEKLGGIPLLILVSPALSLINESHMTHIFASSYATKVRETAEASGERCFRAVPGGGIVRKTIS